MQRYADTLTALNAAMSLMIEEDDTLLVAAISHPLHMAESQLMLLRADMQHSRACPPSQENSTGDTKSHT